MGRHRSPSYDSPSPERTRTQKNGKRSLTDLLEANQRSPSSSPDRSRNRDVGRQRGNRRSPSHGLIIIKHKSENAEKLHISIAILESNKIFNRRNFFFVTTLFEYLKNRNLFFAVQ